MKGFREEEYTALTRPMLILCALKAILHFGKRKLLYSLLISL